MIHYGWFYITVELTLKWTKISNGSIVASMLYCDWFHATNFEALLKLTKLINGNVSEPTLHYDVDSTSLLLNQCWN